MFFLTKPKVKESDLEKALKACKLADKDGYQYWVGVFVNQEPLNSKGSLLFREKDIPEFVLDIIDKRYKIGRMSKYFRNIDTLLLKGELIQNKIDTKDQWAQFIIKNSYYTLEKNKLKSNILTHKKDEFTKDFDKINQFVLTNNICKY